MIKPVAGFIVYGVHKDRMKDPLGKPFIDEKIIDRAKKTLIQRGINIVEHDTIIATKQEARRALKRIDQGETRGAVYETTVSQGERWDLPGHRDAFRAPGLW